MSAELFRAAVAWFEKSKKPEADSFIFPAVDSVFAHKPHYSRFSADKALKRLIGRNYSFHDLRHTMLTRLVNDGKADIRTAQAIAGHRSQLTTEIYLHVPQAQIKAAFENLENRNVLQRLRRRFFPEKTVHVVPVAVGQFKYHVGRAAELARLVDLMQKRVNVYLKADAGLGKTQLLDSLKDDRIIRIHELKSLQKLLENLNLELHERGKPVVIDEMRADVLAKTLTKQSIKTLTDLAIWATEKHEFTLVIDDASELTSRGASMLEKLRDHFHIIVAARQIPTDKAHFLSNFERIELQPLGKSEARHLFELLAADLDLTARTDDIDHLRNHVLENTAGNPLFIIQACSRFGREQWIPSHSISAISHRAAKGQKDFGFVLLAAVFAVIVYKFFGRESNPDDRNAYLLFAGLATAIVFFATTVRRLLRTSRPKFA